MDSNHVCPRCRHLIPNDAMPGAYPGAMSRVDASIFVCSGCGLDEAMIQMTGGTLTGPENWPVTVADDFYAVTDPQRLAELRKTMDIPQ